MPELPDVEVFRRFAENHALKQPIKKVDIEEPKVADSSKDTIQETLGGHQLIKAEGAGKYLILPTETENTLVMHFGMTGWLDYGRDQKPQYTKATFSFDNGYSMYFVNPRKLGKLYITDNIHAFIQQMDIGPDALAVREDDFLRMMKQKKGMLKSALMDQSFLAGIGNIYSDEILFQAGFHPKTRTTDLNEAHLVILFIRMKEVLQAAIEHQANPQNMPEHFIIPRRKEGASCPSCGAMVKKDKLSGRGFYYCPTCQK